MQIDFFQRLSYKLTRTSLMVVIALGIVLAGFDLHTDFKLQQQSVETNVQEIITVTRTPAQRAVYLLDDSLAQEIVIGLVSYDLLKSATLYDENNQIMAQEQKPAAISKYSWLTQYLVGSEKQYVVKINYGEMEGNGNLVLNVDNNTAYEPYFSRSTMSLAKGLLRTVFLALIMVMLYHFLLTRPIFQLTESISRYQHEASDLQSLPDIPGHEEDELGFLIDSFNDLITNLENQKLGLQQREKQLRIVLDSSPNLVFAVNSKMDFTLMNLSTARFYGLSPEELLTRNYYLQHQKINISEAEELYQALISSQSKLQNKVQYEQAMTNHQGQKTVMHMTLKPFLLDGEDSILVIATDITARVEAEERVENLAYYDSLTHLPNRNQVQQILFDDVHNTVDNNGHGAVLFIDIDDFKRINDTLGHSVGDELLLQIANMMNSILANNYHLARLGGDEFILSMPNLAQSAEDTIQIAADFSQKILESIKAPIELDKHLFTIGASIGIAIYPDASTDTDKILQFADTAMYKAKAAGRNTYCVFEASMADEASRTLILESEIRRAIDNHEFTFFLQPLVKANTHEVVGAEALIRWRHPEKGMVMPGDFIPFLETSPMLNKVGNMMLDQICGFISACKEAGRLKPDFRVSINVGANEIYQSNFVELVASTLQRHHVSGKCIEMEITESVALSSFEEITTTMQKLKSHGISFALDDFGTGYSSLNYLKRLPVDKIKIDKSFIDDIPHNTQDAALVGSVIQIANNLKLGVVVEGIEHKVQAEWFESRYELAMQGYLFNRPIPPSEFVETYLPLLKTTGDK